AAGRVVAGRVGDGGRPSVGCRSLPPGLGFPLVHRLSGMLGEHGRRGPGVASAAARQRFWAERQLAAQSSVELLVMGHTHRAAVVEVGPGRYYLNPGAWFDGYRYALVTRNAVELRQFTPPELPPPPRSTDPR